MIPIGKNHLKNTSGGTFVKQRQGGAIVGLTMATPVITRAIPLKDINATDSTATTGPRELSGSRTYNTFKTFSAGTFAYNAAKNKTYIISRITTKVSGVAKDLLSFMATANTYKSFPYYTARRYINNTSLIRKNQYSRTGYDASGAKIVKRTTWLTDPTSSAGTDFNTFASLPTRLVPGELVFLTNFVDYKPATSTNYWDYKPITGK